MVTQERLKELFNYDHVTGIFRHNYSHGRAKAGNRVGTVGVEGYIQIGVGGKIYQAHRLAWLYFYGEFPVYDIDHINGIKSDNAIANLRDIEHKYNVQNIKSPRKHSKTGVLGVRATGRRYAAQIKFNGEVIHIGTFDDVDSAANAYLKKKRELHEYCSI